MNKESEALNYLVNLAVVGNKENNREKVFTSEEIILQALKRNELIKIKTKRVKVSIDDYRIDDYCPTCDEELYTTSNYCPHCGQKLDWSSEK